MAKTPAKPRTILLTDIDGSAALWGDRPEEMLAALKVCDQVTVDAVAAHSGTVADVFGDGVVAAFDETINGIRCAIEIQAALRQHDAPLPLRICIGIDTGNAELREGAYFGPVMNRASRLVAAAHGRQILCSPEVAIAAETHELPHAVFLGNYQLGGLDGPDSVYQLGYPEQPSDLPPIRSREAFPTVGISCSGGGIRAASYALGCLQILDDEGVLRGDRRAKYVSAVSGGSYAVGAIALVEHAIQTVRGESFDSSAQSLEEARSAKAALKPGVGPFSLASPEIRRLRNGLRYLTKGPGGLAAEIWQALLGVVMNLLLFASVAAAVGYSLGWIYGLLLPQIRADCRGTKAVPSCSTAVHIAPWSSYVAIALAMGGTVAGLMFVLRRWDKDGVRQALFATGSALSILAVAWTALVIAGPQLLGWIHRSGLHNSSGVGNPLTNGIIPAGGLAGIGAAIVGLVRSLSDLEQSAEGKAVRSLIFRIKRPLLNLLTVLAVPALFLGLAVLFMHRGSSQPLSVRGTSYAQGLGVAVPVIVLALVGRFGDLNRWSLHTMYKHRLEQGFAIKRKLQTDRDSTTAASGIDAETANASVALHRLTPGPFPEVLICATSNITTYGVAPTGSAALPFVFSKEAVGGPVVGMIESDNFERYGFRNSAGFTVMDAVSISGAAVSPEMGRMTRRPLRFLLALANIRLGVWNPKPSAIQKRRASRVALREALPNPGASNLVHEALGTTRGRSRFVYVTDGGHYDNLGLVELLRPERHCDWIWCIDASGDKIDTFQTLGLALAVAKAEYGVSVEIHPDVQMAPSPDSPRFVARPFCVGSIRYPPDGKGLLRTGTLVVVKAGVPKNAPWEVRAYHQANRDFPCDSTLRQFYNADRFDAYVELGRFSMREAFEACRPVYSRLWTQ